MRTFAMLAVTATLTTAAFAAPTADRWIHVRVVEQNGKGSRVSINVPVGVVTALAPIVQEKASEHARIRVNDREFSIEELRDVMKQLQSAPNGKLIQVKDDDGEVTVVEKSGANFIIRNEDRSQKKTHVVLDGRVIAAMLSGRDGELDLAAGLRALAATGAGDLVVVNDGDDTVRIWIDNDSEGAGR